MRRFIVVLCIVLLLTGCSSVVKGNKETVLKELEEANQTNVGEATGEVNIDINDIEIVKKNIIEEFESNESALLTKYLVKQAYKIYPDDEIISTIYNYVLAKDSIEMYDLLESEEFMDQARSYASKISPDYNQIFSDEMILFAFELLGEEWQAIRDETVRQEERFKTLTLEEKIEINRFIMDRYRYYDMVEGRNSGDKYSDQIWQETSEKFDIAAYYITSIYTDPDVIKIYYEEKDNKEKIEVYDVILDFKNGSSLIALDEKSLDKFMLALVKGDQISINELYKNKSIASVSKGIKANILEKKATRAKVRILEGSYKNRDVWVLIESIIN